MREAAILIVVILRVVIENLKYARNDASGTKLCQSNIFSKLNFYRDKVLMTMRKTVALIVIFTRVVIENLKYAKDGASNTKLCQSDAGATNTIYLHCFKLTFLGENDRNQNSYFCCNFFQSRARGKNIWVCPS